MSHPLRLSHSTSTHRRGYDGGMLTVTERHVSGWFARSQQKKDSNRTADDQFVLLVSSGHLVRAATACTRPSVKDVEPHTREARGADP